MAVKVKSAESRRGSRRQPEASRNAILKAALAEFASVGLAGARMDAIAEAAGVNKALLYYYFQDKDTLYGEIIDAFFAHPQESVRGWEPAIIAQARIVGAVEKILSQPGDGDLAIIGHGGTGTLLYCHLAGLPIDRRYGQPATNGGNWFAFNRTSR